MREISYILKYKHLGKLLIRAEIETEGNMRTIRSYFGETLKNL